MQHRSRDAIHKGHDDSVMRSEDVRKVDFMLSATARRVCAQQALLLKFLQAGGARTVRTARAPGADAAPATGLPGGAPRLERARELPGNVA